MSAQTLTILASRFWPDVHGGVETHMWQYARNLAARGVRVHVLTENRTNALERETILPNLTVRRFGPVDSGRLWRWSPLVELHAWRKRLLEEKPDEMIWASNALLGAAAVTSGFGDRTIYNPAGCVEAMRHIGKLYAHVTTMQRPRVIAWMDKLAFRKAAQVVVSSKNLARQFDRFYGRRDNVSVAPLGATKPQNLHFQGSTRWKFGIERDDFVIGFVGRLDPCKGLDFLFDAAMQASIGKNVRILIAGDGPDELRLRRRAMQLGIADRIIWAGRVDDPAEVYAAMDVLVLPSMYEAFGLVSIEAMHAGIAVIARGGNDRNVLTATDEIIEHERSGYVVDPNDPSDMANRLRTLIRNPMLRRAMQLHAPRTAEAFTWNRYTQQQLELLSRCNVKGDTLELTDPYRLAA